MWPDRVSNPGPPTYESGALPIALRGPATTGDIDTEKGSRINLRWGYRYKDGKKSNHKWDHRY